MSSWMHLRGCVLDREHRGACRVRPGWAWQWVGGYYILAPLVELDRVDER